MSGESGGTLERLQTLALLSPRQADDAADVVEIRLRGRPLQFGTVMTCQPDWDPEHPRWRDHVTVRVLALSCNYRDLSFVALMADRLQRRPSVPFVHFGSDFVGEVVRVGDAVTNLTLGDYVIPTMDLDKGGVLTNEASFGWITAPAFRFVTVPGRVSLYKAAGLALGAQTAASMIRRAAVQPEDRVLIMSSNSATSRLAQALCRTAGVPCNHLELSSSSTLAGSAARSSSPVLVPSGSPIPAKAFDVVIDPFSDLNIATALNSLRSRGHYVTCGLAAQYFAPDISEPPAWRHLVETIIMKNLTLIGNCLGSRQDLLTALAALGNDDIPDFPRFRWDRRSEFLRQWLTDRRSPKAVLCYANTPIPGSP